MIEMKTNFKVKIAKIGLRMNELYNKFARFFDNQGQRHVSTSAFLVCSNFDEHDIVQESLVSQILNCFPICTFLQENICVFQQVSHTNGKNPKSLHVKMCSVSWQFAFNHHSIKKF